MRYILLFVPLFVCSGCMPSIYNLQESEKREVVVELLQNTSLSGKLVDADESSIYLFGASLGDTVSQVRYETHDFGVTYEQLSSNRTKIAKSDIKSIHDKFKRDLTDIYVPRDMNTSSARNLGRIAEVQTNLYNLYVVGLLVTIFSSAALVAVQTK